MSVTEPRPSQRGHMPPGMLKLRRSFVGRAALLDGHRARAADRGDVERERLRRADVRLAEPAEQDAQHRVRVGGGADRGAGVGAHPLLVDDDRGRQPVEDVDVGPGQRRHEALHERAVGLVDQPLRLGGDRAEDQRALARAGDAGEDGQPALRDLDADVLEVVLARAVHADQVVAVGGGVHRRWRRDPASATMLSAAPGCGPCCRRGRGRRSRARRTAARSAPGRPRRRWPAAVSKVPSRSWRGQQEHAVGALGHHLGDGAALVVGDARVGGRRLQHDVDVSGWSAGRR